ncbi:MAG TPA: DUF6496 domain-containing protein [Methylovirgula sp.]|nr:DUF6496 domain-containing protein [Methylovirgula sp.]
MARRQSRAQKNTVGRVMHEYKHGELSRGRGGKVKSRKQAIAIALREAGASKYESPQKNRASLRKTKSKERRGETGQARAEGTGRRSTARKAARKTTARKATARKTNARKTTARKTTARKTATRKSPARKTAARKTARKTSTRKSAARKTRRA